MTKKFFASKPLNDSNVNIPIDELTSLSNTLMIMKRSAVKANVFFDVIKHYPFLTVTRLASGSGYTIDSTWGQKLTLHPLHGGKHNNEIDRTTVRTLIGILKEKITLDAESVINRSEKKGY